MAYQKKCYRSNPVAGDGHPVHRSTKGNSHQGRGEKREKGKRGMPIDTRLGAPSNNHRSRHNYRGITADYGR